MAKLTARFIETAKPKFDPEKGKPIRTEYSDNGSAFRLVVQPGGAKSYATRLWLNGEQIKVTHGSTDRLTLADAHVMSKAAIRDAKNGIDPRDVKNLAKKKRQIAQANTFEAVARLYLDSNR
jgi:hypothetical protein